MGKSTKSTISMAIFIGKILVYQAGYHMVLGFVIYATELIIVDPSLAPWFEKILTGHLQRRLPLGQDIFSGEKWDRIVSYDRIVKTFFTGLKRLKSSIYVFCIVTMDLLVLECFGDLCGNLASPMSMWMMVFPPMVMVPQYCPSPRVRCRSVSPRTTRVQQEYNKRNVQFRISNKLA